MDKEEEQQNPEPTGKKGGAKESTPPAQAPLEKEPLPPFQPRKKSALSLSGIFMFLLLVGAAGGGFLFYQDQERSRHELAARVAELESKIEALESDRKGRKTLRREFAVLRDELSTAIDKQKDVIKGINREIIRLLETVEKPSPDEFAEAQRDDEIAENHMEEPTTALKPSPKRSDDAQDYIDLVESTTEKLFRIIKEGVLKIWDYLAGLIDKLTKN